MSHVDEGQLHAFLDGQLDAVDGGAAQMESHISQCAECRRKLDEVRRTHTRSAAILTAAAPPDTIIPPFDMVVGRAALASRGGSKPWTEDSNMTETVTLPGPRFNHLIASGGQKKPAWTSRTTVVSLFLHSALIMGVVYATVRAPEVEETEELVAFMEIEEEKVEEEKAPEPEKQEAPPPPQATQALTPPDEPPMAIPEVDLSAPAVSAADFTGEGVVAEVAAPAPPAAPAAEPEPEFAYELAELDRKPELNNASTIQSVMERLYPRILQDAGIGGSVTMQFVIEPDGTVDMTSVKVLESPHEQLSEASIKAVERFRFRPGRYKNEPVRVLIQMPITWQPSS